jgi:hypothetical protein
MCSVEKRRMNKTWIGWKGQNLALIEERLFPKLYQED